MVFLFESRSDFPWEPPAPWTCIPSPLTPSSAQSSYRATPCRPQRLTWWPRGAPIHFLVQTNRYEKRRITLIEIYKGAISLGWQNSSRNQVESWSKTLLEDGKLCATQVSENIMKLIMGLLCCLIGISWAMSIFWSSSDDMIIIIWGYGYDKMLPRPYPHRKYMVYMIWIIIQWR